MELDDFEKNALNLKVFQDQMIFSMDVNSFNAPFLSKILKDGNVLRYIPENGSLYLTVLKSNENYVPLKYELTSRNFDFKEDSEKLKLEIKFLHNIDERFENLIKNSKSLLNIKDTLVFPMSIFYKKRFYFLVQYSDKKNVTKRIVDLNNAYRNIVGENSFRIEEISEVKSVSYYLKKYNVNMDDLFLMEYTVEYDGPIPSIKSESVKWPFLDGNELKLVGVEAIRYFGDVSQNAYSEFLKNLYESALTVIYLDGKRDKGKRVYHSINFKETLPIHLKFFNDLIKIGINVDINHYVTYKPL